MSQDTFHQVIPHSLFDVWSPDEVGECLEGLPRELSNRLWNDFVPLYENDPRSEVPDDFGRRCLSKWWDKLTLDEQITLNKCAAAHYDKWNR